MSWWTRPEPTSAIPQDGVSPALLFHKWHRYDGPGLESSESRQEYLLEVARRIRKVSESSAYRRWHELFCGSVDSLGVEARSASTLGRLVVGAATNPALETGLTLHPLLGVPILPGSAVKGLLHHTAEMELAERQGIADGTLIEDAEGFEQALERAESICRIFGSLHLEPARASEETGGKRLGPETFRSQLGRWQSHGKIPEEHLGRVRKLLGAPTGGMLACYDAVPEPGQKGLVEVDVLNSHYPRYYRTEGGEVPSDDQDPIPVFFLAVAAGMELTFRYRLVDRDGAGVDREAGEVARWLELGLQTWGAGAKTAAGYGYFELGNGEAGKESESRESESRESESRESDDREAGAGGGGNPGPSAGPKREHWSGALVSYVPNEGRVVARHQGREAEVRGRGVLGELAEEDRVKLTRKKNRKTLELDVEVEVRGPTYLKLVRVLPPAGGNG